ncbi:zinc finger CCCH domain-containing protein 28-like [Panicum miliaceum]|uniref:Zinc finger CCCH domain-containing protein 28-like n=1 Tax=Panicum miliaceum TaxID=4540 RepID=A0A3L6RVP2_PANMI|nr:zinc finger CCCH domain-containing protein 28-like [Panicum miliaceum]
MASLRPHPQILQWLLRLPAPPSSSCSSPSRSSGAVLLARAAVGGHAAALYSLAVIQFNGSGGAKSDRDLRAGAALCARAAALGHVDALRELGHCLQDASRHPFATTLLHGAASAAAGAGGPPSTFPAMDSAEIPNPSPDATNPAAAAPGAEASSSPPLPPRKRRLSPSPSPRRSASRSRSPCSPSPRGRCSRSRSRSRSRSPQYQPDGKRRRHNDLNVEACRDFLCDRCTRSDLECRYAHPHHSVSVDRENKVTACADSLRNKAT